MQWFKLSPSWRFNDSDNNNDACDDDDENGDDDDDKGDDDDGKGECEEVKRCAIGVSLPARGRKG